MVAFQAQTAGSLSGFRTISPSALLSELADQPAHTTIARLLEHALDASGSDLFLLSNEDSVRVSMRRLGLVETIGNLDRDQGIRCIAFLRTMADIKLEERRRPQDGRWKFPTQSGRQIDLRINTMPTLYGESMAIRILDRASPLRDTKALGLVGPQPELLTRILQAPSGLVLVTGPTGSGKTTTLYACLQQLNGENRKIHTLEDPIEYTIAGLHQTQVSECTGADFYDMLRGVMRQNPDVIMVGEIRDRITAETAIRAANSGQLVFSTLHATTAAAAVQSMYHLGATPEFLATSLLAVISQRLVRTLSRQHRVAVPLESSQMFAPVAQWLAAGDGLTVNVPKPKVAQPFESRTGIFEILEISPVLRELIASRKAAHEIASQGQNEGMFDFRRAALLHVAKGLTSLEEIRRVLPEALGTASGAIP